MKIYEIKQPEEVQKQACLLDNFQDLNFKLRILSLIEKIFSLDFISLTKTLERADQNWAHLYKINCIKEWE